MLYLLPPLVHNVWLQLTHAILMTNADTPLRAVQELLKRILDLQTC